MDLAGRMMMARSLQLVDDALSRLVGDMVRSARPDINHSRVACKSLNTSGARRTL